MFFNICFRCTGVIATKIGKAVAICVGGGIIFIQVANQQGYIKFNWDKIQKSIDKASDKVEEVATGKGPSTLDKVNKILLYSISLTSFFFL